MSRDYEQLRNIRQAVKNYNGDEQLSSILERCFNWMCQEEEDNGCLIQSVALYVALKTLQYHPQICYGLCKLPSGQEFYHAWLELDGRIIDIAIYGNIKWSPLCYQADITPAPVVLKLYNQSPIQYGKYQFDNDWDYASIALVDRMSVAQYIQNAPNQCVRKRIGYILNASRAQVESAMKNYAHVAFNHT